VRSQEMCWPAEEQVRVERTLKKTLGEQVLSQVGSTGRRSCLSRRSEGVLH
jgi:hypothetical protein